MSFFQWDSTKMNLDIEHIDKEHQLIVNIMNMLYELGQKNADKASLLRTLGDLVSVTRKHFRDEESYMEMLNYPSQSTHKMIHDRLLAELDEHVEKFKAGDGKVSDEFFRFLKIWLTAHIVGIDRQYADFGKTAG